jgi:hypothetical protein
MDPVAMSSTTHNLWLTANILGLVVVVAVAALLSLLIYFVKVIDRRVVQVRDAVLAEGLQHHLFLGRVLGKVKT